MISKKELKLLIFFLIVTFLVFFIDLISGDIVIKWSDILTNSASNSYSVFFDFRLPRAMCALAAGAGLSVAGLLLQTLFNNNLAGPYVLGINSGSALFVAFGMLVGGVFSQSFGVFSASILGALLYSLVILSFSRFVKSKSTLLLVGIMLASFTGALISMLQQHATAESIKSFTIWSMGSLQTADFSQALIMLVLVIFTLMISLLLSKKLNILLTGDMNATALGVNIKQLRVLIILSSSIFTGVVTAYCGPIAFIGLAIPNLVRNLSKTRNHFFLLLATFFVGASVLLCCDILLCNVNKVFVMPINALTAMIGAPVVISILLKKK